MENGPKGGEKERKEGKRRKKKKGKERKRLLKSCVFDQCATFFMLEEEEQSLSMREQWHWYLNYVGKYLQLVANYK